MGVCIGYLITIVLSLFFLPGGGYICAAPALISSCGSEAGAVLLQFVLCGILGAACAAGSVIWENDNWSILTQSILHFLLTSLTIFPIAYVSHWMERTPQGLLLYFGIFMTVYLCIWLMQYLIWRRRVKQINKKIDR